jgi:hypothetical protein
MMTSTRDRNYIYSLTMFNHCQCSIIVNVESLPMFNHCQCSIIANEWSPLKNDDIYVFKASHTPSRYCYFPERYGLCLGFWYLLTVFTVYNHGHSQFYSTITMSKRNNDDINADAGRTPKRPIRRLVPPVSILYSYHNALSYSIILDLFHWIWTYYG